MPSTKIQNNIYIYMCVFTLCLSLPHAQASNGEQPEHIEGGLFRFEGDIPLSCANSAIEMQYPNK